MKQLIYLMLCICSYLAYAGNNNADSTLIGGEAGQGMSYNTQHGGSKQATNPFERTLYKCPTGTTWNGEMCLCPSGQFYNGSSCVACVSNQIWNGTQCACPSNLPDWSAAYNICEKCTWGVKGPDGSAWPSIKSCTVSGVNCPSGTSWTGSQCACNSGTSWDTVASSCMTNCVNTSQTSTTVHSCPAPQVGTVTSKQDYTCYNATRGTWGAWYDTSNTCANPCTPTSQTQSVACGAGYTGNKTQQRDYQCPAATWTGWYDINASGCTAIAAPAAACNWGGGTVSWGAGCSAYIGATSLVSGSSTSVNNTAGGYSGTVTYSCNNGTFSQSGAVCNVVALSAQQICSNTGGQWITYYNNRTQCIRGAITQWTGNGPCYRWDWGPGNVGITPYCEYNYAVFTPYGLGYTNYSGGVDIDPGFFSTCGGAYGGGEVCPN